MHTISSALKKEVNKIDRNLLLRNKKIFGDEQIVATKRHCFSYKKGLYRKMDSILKEDIERFSFPLHHYDAEHNPALTQICVASIIFNTKGT